jgi:mannose-1-phosphate guanylyltransferase
MAGGIGSMFWPMSTPQCPKLPEDKLVVIQDLKDCIVAEHDNTLMICQLSEEQKIKEWHD